MKENHMKNNASYATFLQIKFINASWKHWPKWLWLTWQRWLENFYKHLLIAYLTLVTGIYLGLFQFNKVRGDSELIVITKQCQYPMQPMLSPIHLRTNVGTWCISGTIFMGDTLSTFDKQFCSHFLKHPIVNQNLYFFFTTTQQYITAKLLQT